MSTAPSDARAWIAAALGRVESVEALPGGAGRRRYWRVRHADGSSSVLMHAAPENPEILPPALRADVGLPVHASPFVQVGRLLEQNGIPVPHVLALDAAHDWILLEDLGSRHLLDLPDPERHARSLELVELLARVHAIPESDALPFRRCFDPEWIGFELRLFLELVDDSRLRAELAGGFEALGAAIAALPRVLSLRDLQSQNVMIDARGALRLIDYQDALLAPRELDLAALLCDSYVDIDTQRRGELLDGYAAASATCRDPGAFAMLVVQRKCKDLSRFYSLVRAGHDPRYVPALGRAARAVREACASLPGGLAVLAELLPRALEPIEARR